MESVGSFIGSYVQNGTIQKNGAMTTTNIEGTKIEGTKIEGNCDVKENTIFTKLQQPKASG
jgi:hypothetical protein